MWKSEEVCISTIVLNYQKHVEVSTELSDEFENNILLLLDNKGLHRECVNFKKIICCCIVKIKKKISHFHDSGNLFRCFRK